MHTINTAYRLRANGERKLQARNRRNRLLSRATGNQNGFNDVSSAHPYIVSIMGDLHLAPEQMHLFYTAREQLIAAMRYKATNTGHKARVVQLGDLGHGKHASGGQSCFEYAKTFLNSFGDGSIPTNLILGNHDLEGDEYETDEENLGVWHRTFNQHHHWAHRLGPALLVGLSTTRYRSNLHSHHEVYIDDSQFQWLEGLLDSPENKDRPVILFTHAPPIGCGLRVLQNVHVKNRCAWICHSDRPERFIELVKKYSNIRLWFSGHFHLSHNYLDSISVVNRTAFVQTGVIGTGTKDGSRHSRMLEITSDGYKVMTMDHETGVERVDLEQQFSDASPPAPLPLPDEEVLCDPNAGWVCSKIPAEGFLGNDNEWVQWHDVGPKTILASQDNLLVEYDMATSSPIGIVGKVPEGSSLLFLDFKGEQAVGAKVQEVVISNPATGPQVFPRNAEGSFFKIYQPNKWQIKKKERENATAK